MSATSFISIEDSRVDSKGNLSTSANCLEKRAKKLEYRTYAARQRGSVPRFACAVPPALRRP